MNNKEILKEKILKEEILKKREYIKDIIKLNDTTLKIDFENGSIKRSQEYTIDEDNNIDIKFENSLLDSKIYHIIDESNQDEINQKLKYKKGLINFEHTIFLVEVDFAYNHIDPMVLFGGSIFSKKVNFRITTFKERADFSGTTFKEKADFSYTTFEKEASFIETTFEKEVYFYTSTFKEEANFSGTTFEKEVYFYISTFKEKACFYNSTFEKDAIFSWNIFNSRFIFSNVNTKINYKNEYIKIEQKNFKLDLKGAIINSMDYTNTDIKQACNRETFLVLKELAIKRYDSIVALDFHKKEYDKHRKDLSGDFLDKFILGFEYHSSRYGTNVFWPICWILVLNLIFILPLTSTLGIIDSFSIFSSFYWSYFFVILLF